MPITDIKQQLHQAIDAIEDEQYLQALMSILFETDTKEAAVLSEAGLALLKEREAAYEATGNGITLNAFKEK